MFDAIYQYLYRIDLHERLIVAIELILIGGFVYTVISFLEGTRGERLFRGVIFILIVGSLILNFVAREVGLLRIAYLYKGFLLAVLIVAVAAFQPEIRRALIRIGQAGFLSSSPQQLTRSVEEIINAVTQLAAARTGAIIVIEQQVGLAEFIETGVRIDAKVTAELLKTIFYPGSALHDMAVVIQGDRIVAARVQLPLAEGESFQGRQLGSRHRAAVGVTNSSDATVIVVSEETGIVSLAINGNLMRNVSEAQLRRQLTTAVVETTPLINRMKEAVQPRETAE
ncbi:MAG TPA: diadenylate cyclase CdaA [Anaerohalosphaeraceae bacterium]|nr:diadenylate cyclase CdaA [Anaerohalosphaeraceae bacterium]HRT51814.1 diadenylate cyclase CdaA [Anaerohalosphaeraceae bacterium]HRT87832.1 diadenylate cyclase CdaA [Anaerohalosphaeraceae bacterium]